MKKKPLLIALSAFMMLTMSGCFLINRKSSSSSSSNEESSSQSSETSKSSQTTSSSETTSSSSGSSTSSSSSSTVQKTVTVNFYADYNQIVGKNVYYTCEVINGNLISDVPANPSEPPLPEFPVFKGWSEKEIIDNLGELWDFDNDVVNTTKSTFNLFGIWVAEGE